MDKIVVGVDGSTGSTEALQWAWRESRLRDTPLVAVMAWGLLEQYHADPDQGFDANYGPADAQAALEAAVVTAVGAADADVVERRVVNDLPAATLLDAVGADDLLVVGARGQGGFRGLLLGSVSQHCLNHSRSAVAVIRAGATDRPAQNRVVAGFDGSEPAKDAVHWSLEEGRLRGAAVEVVHTWQIPYLGVYPYVGDAFDTQLFERAAREMVDTVLADADVTGLASPVQRTIVNGSPARAILEASKAADLVVVGARGLGGFTGLVLGSVSQQVARHATCPVVVMPSER